ncbi:uncharacterized protein LOC143435398 isoform X2 [Arvicanthis niloticus]|uniref:uncharacterized protein LOC143435398 isoform X2 n=1 Tax=Arvicanthis niloticus TaxID=61156 RepID=UPI00403CCD6A
MARSSPWQKTCARRKKEMGFNKTQLARTICEPSALPQRSQLEYGLIVLPRLALNFWTPTIFCQSLQSTQDIQLLSAAPGKHGHSPLLRKHSHSDSQPSVTPVPRDPVLSSEDTAHSWFTGVHSGRCCLCHGACLKDTNNWKELVFFHQVNLKEPT